MGEAREMEKVLIKNKSNYPEYVRELSNIRHESLKILKERHEDEYRKIYNNLKKKKGFRVREDESKRN